MQKQKHVDLPDGIQQNVSLQSYTTWRVGGVAQYFVEPATLQDMLSYISWAKKARLPITVLGFGSNCLVADEGVKGLVIVTTKLNKMHALSCGVVAECGVSLAQLLQYTLQQGWGGLEWSAGIPSTIGGAVRGNAGAFGESISSRVVSVLAYTENGVQLCMGNCLQFAYRTSIFKQKPWVILSVCLAFSPKPTQQIQQRVQECIAYRKRTQPQLPSAGSVFLQVQGVSAGYYIDKAQLKGVAVGGAMVSPEHANFIVNIGSATASNILQLIKLIRREVYRKFHIKLQTEISYIGGNVGGWRLPYTHKI